MIELLNGEVETVVYNECKSVKVYKNETLEDYPLHWHLSPEIITPIINHYTVIINNETITVNSGETIIIAQGELHQLASPSAGERLILLFDLSLIQNIGNLESILPFLHPYTHITHADSNHAYIKDIMLYIYELYSSRDIFKETLIFSELIKLYTSACRQLMTNRSFSSEPLSKQSEYGIKFMQICGQIKNNCQEALTLEAVAEAAGFSKFHFTRLFKQFTGVSYYDYLNDCRVKKAAGLLIVPGVSVTDAAMESGFNCLSTFNRVFKKYKNCTPTEYKDFYYSRMAGVMTSSFVE